MLHGGLEDRQCFRGQWCGPPWGLLPSPQARVCAASDQISVNNTLPLKKKKNPLFFSKGSEATIMTLSPGLIFY